MIAYKYNENGIYVGTQSCQLNPIATKREGHDIWLIPAKCTEIEPPTEKDGYNRVFTNGKWEYVEIPTEPTPPEPTAEEIKAQAKAKLDAEFDTAVRDVKDYFTTAQLLGDAGLQTALQEEYADIVSQYDAAIEDLEG